MRGTFYSYNLIPNRQITPTIFADLRAAYAAFVNNAVTTANTEPARQIIYNSGLMFTAPTQSNYNQLYGWGSQFGVANPADLQNMAYQVITIPAPIQNAMTDAMAQSGAINQILNNINDLYNSISASISGVLSCASINADRTQLSQDASAYVDWGAIIGGLGLVTGQPEITAFGAGLAAGGSLLNRIVAYCEDD